jgi:hypothetical protein
LEAKVFAKIMADMHITDIIVREDTAVSQAEQVSNAPSKEE